MTTYNELRKINCNEFTERKGSLTYLSWTYAVDILLQHDPMATWEWGDIVYFNETAMVSCSVTALGKTMKMQLPVMHLPKKIWCNFFLQEQNKTGWKLPSETIQQ